MLTQGCSADWQAAFYDVIILAVGMGVRLNTLVQAPNRNDN
jgi:hypothetical protein